MAKKKQIELTIEEKLQNALVPKEEQPYKIPSNWCWTYIHNIAIVVTGKTPSKKNKEYYGGKFPFFKPADLDAGRNMQYATEYLSEKGKSISVIIPEKATGICCIGTIGKCGYFLVEGTTNQQINTIIVDASKHNPKYIYYVLSLKQEELKSIAGGSATPILNKGHFSKVVIELPDKVDQDNIVQVLDSLDCKIELNNQINQTLESIAQAIFKSWFIDFEPVRAKIAAKQEGKDPELAAMCAISGKSEAELDQLTKEDFAELQATAALFPDELVESELGEVPRGWSSVSIGSLIDLTIGGDWGKEVKDEKYKVQARVIRGTDIPSIKIGLDEQVPTRYIESKKLRTRELKLGDIVIEVSGGSPKQSTGRTIYISNEILLRLKDPVIPASFCRLLRPNSHELGVFLSIYLQKIYVEGKTWLYQNQSTGISNFQTTVFLEKEILTLPPLILLEEFEKIITPIIKKIDSSERLFLSNLRLEIY